MKEAFAQISTPEGAMRAFTTHPEEGGPFPAVMIFMDVWGLREELYEIARRVATVGYYAVVPDFYHRLGTVSFDYRDAQNKVLSVASLPKAQRDLVEGTLAKLTNVMVVQDTGALLNFLAAQPLVRSGEKGAIGYCMGGRHAFCAATHYPSEFGATAALHGTALISKRPDSPHHRIADMRGEVYCGFGERDPHTPPALVAELAERMRSAKVRYRHEVHSGAEHGYALPCRDVYDSRAAARDWELIFAMFHRRLPAQGRPVPA